jgi:DNA-binding CsgD family transcriptional regulator
LIQVKPLSDLLCDFIKEELRIFDGQQPSQNCIRGGAWRACMAFHSGREPISRRQDRRFPQAFPRHGRERRLAVEGSPVVLMREHETPMIAHTFAPADADAKVVPFPSAVNVTITRLDDLPVPSESILMRVFDLTIAEVRVAQGLACGHSLDETATRLGIKITTARTELASIFGKTGTCRQGQLVAVLSHLAHTEC